MKKIDFNTGWKYRKAGGEYKEIVLPHDAMIHEKREANAPGGSALAFFPGGEYEYVKEFAVPAEWKGEHVLLQFDGVYKNSKVYLDDTAIGGCDYGYLPFTADLGTLADGVHQIRVTCENKNQPDSRWYTGAGIYRPVYAWVGAGLFEEDIKVTTKSINPAVIVAEIDPTRLNKDSLAVSILNPDFQKVVETEITRKEGFRKEIVIEDAKLWSEDAPNLYSLVCDDVSVAFGIREITYSPEGLFANGVNTLLRGGCVHHDNGILGAAAYRESEFRKVRILKDAGYNAIRSSHNPCSKEFLDACDFYGMYLIDEAWDMWYKHKSAYDYADRWQENHLSDLDAMVSRDHNHPCVIGYSIGNEVSEPAREKGINMEKEMVEHLHNIDPTRFVTGGYNLMIIANSAKGKDIYDEESGGRKEDKSSGFSNMNSTMFNLITSMVGSGMNKAANSDKADKATSPALDELDIAGYNYASGRYKLEGSCHPDRLIYGSETFPGDIAKNWEDVKKYPYLIGDFMWTAWDYIGEAGIGAWAYTKDGKGFDKPYPWLLGDTGAFDILGTPNGEAFLAAAAWDQLSEPVITVQPVNHPEVKPSKGAWRSTNSIRSWSWSGCEGNQAVVEVYYNCDRIELLINGKSLGKKKVKNCKAVFKTKYRSGKIEAAAYDAKGNVNGQSSLMSCKKAEVHILPEQTKVREGDILYVPIEIGDGTNTECNQDQKLSVSVENGELLAFGSANPRTEETFDSFTYTTYYGKALAAVRAGKKGSMQIKVNDASAEICIIE